MSSATIAVQSVAAKMGKAFHRKVTTGAAWYYSRNPSAPVSPSLEVLQKGGRTMATRPAGTLMPVTGQTGDQPAKSLPIGDGGEGPEQHHERYRRFPHGQQPDHQQPG